MQRAVPDASPGLAFLSSLVILSSLTTEAVGQRGASARDGAKVEAVGLRVVGEPYGGRDDMRPFNYYAGTTAVLLLTRPGGGLIAMDDDASEVTRFADERGKDLLVEGKFSQPGFSAFPRISEDGAAALVEVSGGAVPTRGATTVSIGGKAVLKVATKKATHERADVAVKKGTSVEIGPFRFTVVDVGKPDWGDEPLQITFEAKQELDALAEIRFTGPDGKAIEHHSGGTMTSRMGNQVNIRQSYRLVRKVDRVSIEVDAWTDLRTIEVPIDVKVGIGL
jgi:hypothetical protein